MASVRHIVDDVDAAVAFSGQRLGFRAVMHPAPDFAMLVRRDLRLPVASPAPAGSLKDLFQPTIREAREEAGRSGEPGVQP